uniref:E3 SUMO-protein ligase EGR2 n=1 Tax=Strongyloides papillosus TaxID=174720 RepID=A0A0N5BV55_STREA
MSAPTLAEAFRRRRRHRKIFRQDCKKYLKNLENKDLPRPLIFTNSPAGPPTLSPATYVPGTYMGGYLILTLRKKASPQGDDFVDFCAYTNSSP